MRSITLRLRDENDIPVDASSLRLDELADKSPDQMARLVIRVSSANVELGEVFQIDCRDTDADQPSLVLQGGCRSIHRLGHQHRVGRIVVEADIGDYCGACMSGGTITIAGNAGDYLGAPTGSRGVGMNGGQIAVAGNVGDFAGSRMRRGEIWIAGNAGTGLASWQVAGTIGVGGVTGDHIGYGMRRGTLILATPTSLPRVRFTPPIELDTPFHALIENRSRLPSIWPPAKHDAGARRWWTSRGDRCIGGIGEVWHRAQEEFQVLDTYCSRDQSSS